MLRVGRAHFSSEAAALSKAAINDWVKKLSSRATSAEGKTLIGQVNTLVSYYGQAPSVDAAPEINWAEWQDKIATKGLVEKIKTNFEVLEKEEYNDAEIAEKISGAPTEEYQKCDSELKFHRHLWMTYFDDHMTILARLKFFSSFLDISDEEICERLPHIRSKSAKIFATGDFMPGALDDVNFYGYLLNEFSWGKNLVTFYRHPTQDDRMLKATNLIMGK